MELNGKTYEQGEAVTVKGNHEVVIRFGDVAMAAIFPTESKVTYVGNNKDSDIQHLFPPTTAMYNGPAICVERVGQVHLKSSGPGPMELMATVEYINTKSFTYSEQATVTPKLREMSYPVPGIGSQQLYKMTLNDTGVETDHTYRVFIQGPKVINARAAAAIEKLASQ